MRETLLSYTLVLIIIGIPLIIYLMHMRSKEAAMLKAAEKGKLFSEGPKAQHPQIDLSKCIGCGSCVRVCPEGDVLGLIGGKALIINGYKCVGHALCEEACPVDAIKMVMAAPSMSADLPFLTPEHETNISNLFIAGELGGLALIKNAVTEGRECIDTISARLHSHSPQKADLDAYDVCIAGAGPAGISASLRAIQNGIRYLTLEQSDIGGMVARYPRQKLVMTSPVEFPLYGKFKKMALSKEEILEFWKLIGGRADFVARTCEAVEDIRKDPDGCFTVGTSKGKYRAYAMIMALGRSGTPRKLGVKGEDLSKVMYRLIEVDVYTDNNILVVGGGDSAVEAAVGLATQKGNNIYISYRRDSFSRIKERNSKRLEESIRSGKVRVLFNSMPVEIKPDSVILDCSGTLQEIPNDYVWIFAGGVAPNDFLQKIGIQFGTQPVEK
jgi:thioredoxin reductase/Pyruvate/2-oxoacid:ferredoxin oxidoreductase delta subunit